MVGRRQVHQAIHSRMMKRNADDDVVQWDQIVSTLVTELKHEVAAFYGNEGSDLEKQYPGFDYHDEKIRARLSRWSWHRSFFKAIDYLGLSESEIDSVVTWWGTLKERRMYEKRTGRVIRDTTGDDIPTWEEVQNMKLEKKRQDDAIRYRMLAFGIQQEEVETLLKDADRVALQQSLQQAVAQSQETAAILARGFTLEPLYGVARE
ncbi:hypothetical protein H072_3487 [Dactylellina haptotyla CBS 200.50]|uniref:Uncharacterized protein n=1 Tax=Dactylellina haptotyla (strain CBS 200.50) TaxID=1284197 RepID=S8AI39_DACHA|nr:hypothetical protein H072_3487 [Dactylellina haptotyla CBS 200.50]